MHSTKIKLCFLGWLISLCPLLHGQTDVYLKIYDKTFQRMEIDLYPLIGETMGRRSEILSGLITEVISNDLWMSGFFKVNLRAGRPRFAAANDGASSRALAVLSGHFRFQGNKLTIQPILQDRVSGRTILKNDYTDNLDNQRYLIHKISDDIVYSLTGENGIARTKIAFVSQQRNNVKEIAMMDYDGYNVQKLTRDQSINLSPAWSPDGSKICFTSYKKQQPFLFEYSLLTRTDRQISNHVGLNSSPAWSPDGRKIAFTVSKDGNAELYTLDLVSHEFRRLTFNRAIDSSPSWSPSNREMAFISDRAGTPQIYIMDSDGANTRRLTFEGSYNASPSWSPRGDKIAFVSRTDSGFDIYTIDVTGENSMRLTDSSGSNEDPSWSPNGYALIFSSNRSGKRELYSMFWDGSDQKRISKGGIFYSPAWSPRAN
ncbi:MAG: Tol-Pal system beta propeller repeat protein TolB [bacterium]